MENYISIDFEILGFVSLCILLLFFVYSSSFSVTRETLKNAYFLPGSAPISTTILLGSIYGLNQHYLWLDVTIVLVGIITIGILTLVLHIIYTKIPLTLFLILAIGMSSGAGLSIILVQTYTVTGLILILSTVLILMLIDAFVALKNHKKK